KKFMCNTYLFANLKDFLIVRRTKLFGQSQVSLFVIETKESKRERGSIFFLLCMFNIITLNNFYKCGEGEKKSPLKPTVVKSRGTEDASDGYFDRDLRYRTISPKLFEEMENTKEFQETQYYKIGFGQSTTNLIPPNHFWFEYGQYLLADDYSPKKPFVSQHFTIPVNTLTEMLCALAVFDLPLTSDGNAIVRDKNFELMEMKYFFLKKKAKNVTNYLKLNKSGKKKRTISSAKPCIVLSKQMTETKNVSLRVSVSQHYFDPQTKHEIVDGEQTDKFVNPDSLTPLKTYGCRAIITNASSAQIQNVEVLYQIPVGAIPMNNGKWTHTQFETIPSYASKIMEFFFYFPSVGKYRHFPVQISKGGKILGTATNNKNNEIQVKIPVASEAVINEDNWGDVSGSGNAATICKYLKQHNVYGTDLTQIYYMCGDKAFFNDLIAILRSKLLYDNEIWKYALNHQQVKEWSEYLAYNSQSLRYMFEPCFQSDWHCYDDLDDHKFTHLEYFPLINGRAHVLGSKKKILNDTLLESYRKYLSRASYLSRNITNMPWVELLKACYYLILQDRINEAVFIFNECLDKKDKNDNKESINKYQIQFDYIKAYLAIFDESDKQLETARDIAKKWSDKKLPLNKQRLFEDIEYQLSELNDFKRENEIEKEDETSLAIIGERDRRMDQNALSQPSISFEIENRKMVFNSYLVNAITVNFYRMDIELLFSMSPFLEKDKMQDSKNVFSFIQPNESLDINFNQDKDEKDAEAINIPHTHKVEIPKSLWNCNMYCEVIVRNPSNYSSTRSLCRAFYDHRLLVQVKEKFGQLKVLDKENKKPISKCYVKVYAMVNESPKFHKDGYTDRRGVFDYVSVSCDHLTQTKKFAVLVHSEDRGSVVETADVPKLFGFDKLLVLKHFVFSWSSTFIGLYLCI
ncbi:hypothetical protein RFI_31694, partial [Reticulomyxa filosa]